MTKPFEYIKPPPGMLLVYNGYIEFIVSPSSNSFDEYTLTFCPEEGVQLRSYLTSIDITFRRKIAILKYPLAFYET